MSPDTGTDAGDGTVLELAGGGLDAVLAASMMRSARIPADTAARVTGAILRSPRPATRQLARGLWRQLAVGLGTGEDLPRLDRRFADPAWHGNPVLRRLALSYLVWADALREGVAATPLDWRTRQRATLLIDNLIAAAAPANVPLVNPASAKRAWETGGQSLLRGLRYFAHDMSRPPRLPPAVDSSAFTIGKDVAATPGAVVHRGDIFELIQYAPASDQVDGIPVLHVASPVNKFYLLDLGAKNSVIGALQAAGRQSFIVSWVNPDERHRDVGLDRYVQAVLEMLGAIREISGSEQVHLLGLCGGGTITLAAAGYLAATGRQHELATLTLGVAIADYSRGGIVGALVDEQTARVAAEHATRRGYIDAAEVAAGFAWIRPDEGVWMQAAVNYLLGERPRGSELLFWAADNTNMTARLNNDQLALLVNNSFVTPGALRVLGAPVDLRQVTVGTYLLGASTDHIMPWMDCYRTRPLLGGPTRFVLAAGGHAKALGSPPGAPRSSYRTGGSESADPAEWLQASVEHPGSWWQDWSDWIAKHTPATGPAPAQLGSQAYPPLADAPGEFVHRRAI